MSLAAAASRTCRLIGWDFTGAGDGTVGWCILGWPFASDGPCDEDTGARSARSAGDQQIVGVTCNSMRRDGLVEHLDGGPSWGTLAHY